MFAPLGRDRSPLTVEVSANRYEMYGDPTNPRHTWLATMLKQMGGINESVEPGTYHFNLRRRGLQLVASLNPAE